MVQRLRLGSQCRGSGFDPWSGNSIPHATTKILHAATKTQLSQINIKKKTTNIPRKDKKAFTHCHSIVAMGDTSLIQTLLMGKRYSQTRCLMTEDCPASVNTHSLSSG